MANLFYSSPDEEKRLSGKNGTKSNDEYGRSAYQKDYARLLHAPSFRRLQNKTQLFPGAESDFFRNRLTHSLEVAQIAGGIASRLNSTSIKKIFPRSQINECLVEFAGIAHDLGHPPFGHNGEHALNDIMRPFGGFEGNAQTLRILTSVERKTIELSNGSETDKFGLDLTYRTLASVLKYDNQISYTAKDPKSKLKKGYYSEDAAIVREIKKRVAPNLKRGEKFKTIECAIMDMADDIAYSTYDLEDTLHAGFVSPMMLAWTLAANEGVRNAVTTKTNEALIGERYHKIYDSGELLDVISAVFEIPLPAALEVRLAEAFPENSSFKDILSDSRLALMINAGCWDLDQSLKLDTRARTRFTSERVGRLINSVQFVPDEENPQLSRVTMSREALLQVEVMKHLNYELVIRSPQLAMVENRGVEVVKRIYSALYKSKGTLLPSEWRNRFLLANGKERAQRRIVCDFVACMTDRYAAEMDARLFGEGSSIFKPF